MRSYAREVAFCKIYTYIMSGAVDEDYSQFDENNLTEDDTSFVKSLVGGVVDNKPQLDEVIAEFSKSFKLSRIYKIDLALLEIAIYEMSHTDTPHAVIINEAVGLAKKYSTEKSPSFVNGLLAGYERSLHNE